MNVSVSGSNFGFVSVYVTNDGATLTESFHDSDKQFELRRDLADEFINASYDLATKSGFIHDSDPWIKILSAYFDEDMCDKLKQLVSGTE